MASPASDLPARRWALVLDMGAEPRRVFTVRSAEKAGEVFEAVRAALEELVKRGGCRSMVIGVHVEGPACDHELGGA
jgi:hypothetical protein